MSIKEKAEEIRVYLWKNAFCVDEVVVSQKLELMIRGTNPIELYQFAVANFSRIEAELLFTYSPRIWGSFALAEWETLLRDIDRQPDTNSAIDHSGFSDIWFLVSLLGLNAFRIAARVVKHKPNLQRIVEYGLNNCTILLKEKTPSDDDVSKDDLYDPIFSKCREATRSMVLACDPTLDVDEWSIVELETDLQSLCKSIVEAS